MLETITAIAREAGAAIMEIYAGDDFAVETKADDSPLTRADRASHAVIVAGLQAAFPDIPILSEEGRDIPWQERRHWQRFWLVDPLDGTKEFIKRNGEFTVNIALVEGGEPVLGVVHVPALATTYLGRRGEGAWRERNGDRQAIRPTCPAPGTPLAVVMSRSHPSVELDAYLKQIEVGEAVPVGSSLKLCAVAEGRADLYPRLGPTMEWDTAAGQAVAEAAGARVLAADGQPLRYNKPKLLNPWFVVFGAGWQAPLPPAKEEA
ncbi:MAG: 3'(2'),5'-bisphosphate nucleotidase CysQ [Geothermobacteraceae bacterium]